MANGLKIGSAVAIVGLIAFLFIRIDNLKDAQQVQTQEIYRLEWLLSAKEAEVETLKVIAQYSVPETVIVSRVRVVTDTITARVDTLYEDIAAIYGSIEIDTTKEFGPDSNPLAVRVWGRFWYPEEYSHRNRMLIYPILAEKPPYLPVTPRSPDNWGIGLVYIRSVNVTSGNDYFGVSVRYSRLILASGYDPWAKSAIGGIGLEILRF